jgi:hypothetical protein
MKRTAGVIFLSVLAINGISRMRKRRPQARPPDGNAITLGTNPLALSGPM